MNLHDFVGGMRFLISRVYPDVCASLNVLVLSTFALHFLHNYCIGNPGAFSLTVSTGVRVVLISRIPKAYCKSIIYAGV